MTPTECLDLIKLLSAIESWGFAQKENLPDYLHERLADAMDLLTKEIIK